MNDYRDRLLATAKEQMQGEFRAALHQLEEELQLDDINERLTTITGDLKEAERRRREAARTAKGVEDELTNRETMITVQVHAEIDQKTGKPVYSNSEQRKAEIHHRLVSDIEYQTIQARLREARRQQDECEAEFTALENEARMLQTRVRFTVARIELFIALG